jgi:hypothetical protein
MAPKIAMVMALMLLAPLAEAIMALRLVWQLFLCACLTAPVRAAPRLLLLASTGSLQTTLQAHPPLQTCRSVVDAPQHLTLQFDLLWLMAWYLWWLRATAQQMLVSRRPQVSH